MTPPPLFWGCSGHHNMGKHPGPHHSLQLNNWDPSSLEGSARLLQWLLDQCRWSLDQDWACTDHLTTMFNPHMYMPSTEHCHQPPAHLLPLDMWPCSKGYSQNLLSTWPCAAKATHKLAISAAGSHSIGKPNFWPCFQHFGFICLTQHHHMSFFILQWVEMPAHWPEIIPKAPPLVPTLPYITRIMTKSLTWLSNTECARAGGGGGDGAVGSPIALVPLCLVQILCD